jgi:hypothetical protein
MPVPKSAEGLTFTEFLKELGPNMERNAKAFDPDIFSLVGGDEVSVIYEYRRGPNRVTRLTFPKNVDRLRAYHYALYDRKGGEDEFYGPDGDL